MRAVMRRRAHRPVRWRVGTLSTWQPPNSTVMHGDPDCRLVLVSPFHAMARTRRDVQIVAAPERARYGFTVKQNGGGACDDDDPFGLVLIVPEAWRA